MAVPCARCGAPVGPTADKCVACGEPCAPAEDLLGRTVQRWSPVQVSPSIGDPRVGQVVAGRYRIVRRLGQGGMGAVYAGWQLGAEQPVALKFIHSELVRDPDAARRFTNEARSYAKLQHPNAITLHDVGQDETGAPFICMELFQGEDLASTLAQRKRLSVAEAVEIGLQIADVLAHAHAQGIVHRDLKPENVLIKAGLRGTHVKVVDFGIARLLGDPSSATLQGPTIGTPGYMAPEQIRAGPVDGRSDVYALGIVLFHLVTGRHPFEGARSLTEMMFAQVSTPMPALQAVVPELQLPPALDAIVQRATRKDPAERYQKMEELIEALGALQRAGAAAPASGEGIGFEKTARAVPPTSALRPAGSRRWVVAAGAVVALVAAAGALGVVTRSPPRVDPPAPRPSPPHVAAAEPPAAEPSSTAREVERVLARQTALDVLVKSRAELSVGNLEGARQLLDGSKEVLDAVSSDPQLQPQVESLRAELARVGDALSRAQALARRGDCAGAIKLYDGVLKSHPGLRQARAAREQCRRMLPPQLAE